MENNPTILRLTPDLYKAMDADRRKKLSRAMQEGKVKVEVVVPESVDSLKTPAGSAKTPVPSGAAIAEAFAKGEKRLEEQKSKGWWDKAKDIVSEVRSGAKKAGAELMEPVAQGAQNVIDVISPIDVEVSKSPSIGDEISKELDNTIDKESTPYRVYERLGELSRTDRGFHDIVGGKASQEDVSTYKKNREHLLLDVMGYTDIGEDKEGKTWIQEKGGKWLKLDEGGIKQVVAEAAGDKGEMLGAIAGATAGVKSGKALGTKGKIIGGVVGGALGAMGGNALDQLSSYLRNGEELSFSQRMGEANKAAAIDVAAAGVGAAAFKTIGATLKIAGKTVVLPAKASRAVFRHIANANIDGATTVLKRDLKIDDAYLDDALLQMQALQKEQYVHEANPISRAVDIIADTPSIAGAKQAVKELGDTALDRLGAATEKERILAATMKHEQGAGLLAQGLKNNPRAALELERSIDARAKQVQLITKDGMDGTEVKRAVTAYENKIQQHYSQMRESWKEAFSETKYKFDLDSLGIGKKIDELGKRVVDPVVRDRFIAMSDAIEEIAGKRSSGITRDISDLLDIRQLLNKFYRKNENILFLKPDRETFRGMVASIDAEIERAATKQLPEELRERLLKDLYDAIDEYREMSALQKNPLYKGLMAEGKSSQERMSALLKHVEDDADELKQLLEKLPKEQAQKIEAGIIDATVQKHTLGDRMKMEAVNYSAAIEELRRLEPFLKDKYAKAKINILERLHNSFRHDFELAKFINGVTEATPSGGIATSVSGRAKAALVSGMFSMIVRLKPIGEGSKRLALYHHLGVAMKKTRNPITLVRKMVAIKSIPTDERRILKALIKDFRAVKSTENAQLAAERERAIKEQTVKNEAKIKAREGAIASFVIPSPEEIRAVESLAGDDTRATFAQAIRRIADGKGSTRDIERYLDAKAKIGEDRVAARVQKWQVVKAQGDNK